MFRRNLVMISNGMNALTSLRILFPIPLPILLLLLAFALPQVFSVSASASFVSAKIVVPGAVQYISLNQGQQASCEVVRRRLTYQLVRRAEQTVLIDKIKNRHVITTAELQDLKRILSRLQARIPGETDNNEMIYARWEVPAALSLEAKVALARGGMRVRIGDTEWVSKDGYLPDDVSFIYRDGHNGEADSIELRFSTNSIDACLGPSDVEIEVNLDTSRSIDFVVLGPNAPH